MFDFDDKRGSDLNRKVMHFKVLMTLFLGSIGVSSLIPLYYFAMRKKNKGAVRGWTFHEDRIEPLSRLEMRARIRPVRGDGLVCQICMGKLKSGLPYIRCECGKVFHLSCLKRTGFCPYCQKDYPPEDVENGAIYPNNEGLACPVCGRLVCKDPGRCECGAIIADEDGKFYCPGCGTQIEDSENECPYCHERFEDVSLVQCPFCGKVFEEGGVCECGTFLGEVCPECGVRLSVDDRVCPACGVSFELLSRR